MADDWSQMAGEVQTRLGRHALAARLVAAGIRAEVRESCHFAGGRYVRVCEADEFTLERVTADEYLAWTDAGSVEQMFAAASRVSAALTGLGIRHRFEVYDGRSDMEHYLHHLWPEAADA